MTFFEYLAASALFGSLGCGAACTAAAAQQPSPSQSNGQKPASKDSSSAPASPQSKVVFSRSANNPSPAGTPQKGAQVEAGAPFKITDAERSAVIFTAYDLDIRLTPHTKSLAVRCRFTFRNGGDQPLGHLALQVSSSLNWEQITLGAKPLAYVRQTVNSDTDHTGQFHEALLALPEPLAPDASLTLDALYSGPIELGGKRLEQIGTPTDVAQHSDWDQISDDFTGLRGFGNVAWYPVSSLPVALGDGNKLFAEIGAQKLRQADAIISMHVTEEFSGITPNAAVLDGRFVDIPPPSVSPTTTYPGIVNFALPPTRLGFATPVLVLAARAATQNELLRLLARTADSAYVPSWQDAATAVQPLMQQWLGAKPRTPLTLLDLDQPLDSPYETGSVLLTGFSLPDPDKPAAAQFAVSLSHALAHAWFQSPREYLNEGVPQFLGTLYVEQTQGRQAALEHLEATRGALALAEPSDPGSGSGEDLLHASSAIYYRSKAAYVLWMLRDLAGDGPLSAALRAYNPAEDTAPDYFEKLIEKASGKDLRWFFDDWVYHDKGLPDLSIASVFPGSASAGQTLVSIDVANDGYAAADVPLTVRSDKTSITERIHVPARGKMTRRVLLQGQPTEILLNDGTVPEVQASVHQHNISNTGGSARNY